MSLITVEDTAKMLCLSRGAIYGWISAGACPFRIVRLGKKHGPVRFYRADVEEYIEERTEDPEPALKRIREILCPRS